MIYVVSGVAETNRHPFDVVEGESRDRRRPHGRVLGDERSRSSSSAEYANMILLSTLATIMFLGGWSAPIDVTRAFGIPLADWFVPLWDWMWLFAKMFFIVSLFVWFRAIVPALPLRPDHAARLEDLHPADAGLAGGAGGVDADAVEHLEGGLARWKRSRTSSARCS